MCVLAHARVLCMKNGAETSSPQHITVLKLLVLSRQGGDGGRGRGSERVLQHRKPKRRRMQMHREKHLCDSNDFGGGDALGRLRGRRRHHAHLQQRLVREQYRELQRGIRSYR